MRARLLTAVAGILAAGLAHGSTARACGATAPPFYVVERQAPTSAAAPLNTPLLVTLTEEPSGPADDGFAPTLTLTKAGSDLAVELKPLGGLPTLSWIPVAPLEPETTYEAHFNPGYEGIPDTIWPFTTGTESAPPLSLEGELHVTLESGVEAVDVCNPCVNKCGNEGDCAAACRVEFQNVTKARVTLPRAVNGFAQRTGALWLTDDKPYDFSEITKTLPEPYRGANVSVLTYADLDDPNITEVSITLPEAELAYKPCFAFEATDARSDRAAAAPLCLDAPFPAANQAEPDPNQPGDGLANDIIKPRTSSGCSVGHPTASGSAWLAALAVMGLTRKRRRPASA
jgi:MYXO-CTERM domain-containing protein